MTTCTIKGECSNRWFYFYWGCIGCMVTDVSYDDGLLVFFVLGFLWLVFSYELAVVVGLAWAIGGISRSNALKLAERDGK